MRRSSIRARIVCLTRSPFLVGVILKHSYGLAIMFYPWGIRIILGWVHFCFHYAKSEQPAREE